MIPAAGAAAAIWAIAMWWMVATLPSAGASEAELDLTVARAEIERLQLDMDDLSQEIAALHQVRSELSLRLDAVERSPAVMSAQAAGMLGGPPPATAATTAPIEETPTNGDGDADNAEATPTPKPNSTATATPTAVPTAQPTAVVEPTATPTAVQYFTDGRDRYNCKDFDSWEEAQAAYEANLPGDPNKIDIDRNGIACEALR